MMGCDPGFQVTRPRGQTESSVIFGWDEVECNIGVFADSFAFFRSGKPKSGGSYFGCSIITTRPRENKED